jgi:regulation of enolase protein 1 (concanavalin A-like superfamily)
MCPDIRVGTAKVKAFYAHLYDQSGVLGKVDGTIYFFGDDGTITEYEPDMANFCTVLGETSLADTQRIMDRLHGGATFICTHRAQEVS